ncbi:MAG: hypothetical protein M3Q10_09920 [Chloroflexota bacterium]|nr:hypothetical protein [Chloroflexota bacterium]
MRRLFTLTLAAVALLGPVAVGPAAVVLVSNLRGVDEPARQFHEGMATPAA